MCMYLWLLLFLSAIQGYDPTTSSSPTDDTIMGETDSSDTPLTTNDFVMTEEEHEDETQVRLPY